MLITIEEKDNKLKVNLSEDITWTIALQMLAATLKNLAVATVERVTVNQAAELKLTKAQALDVRNSVKEDVADMLNFAISNVLNDICPKDPNLQVTEVAIATIENEIIHYAKDNNLTLKKALEHYEEKLKEHPYYAGKVS